MGCTWCLWGCSPCVWVQVASLSRHKQPLNIEPDCGERFHLRVTKATSPEVL